MVSSGQGPTAPGQPSFGPGGSTHPFASFQTYGPFNDSPGGDPAYNYYFVEPASPTPATAPIALFLHGYQADSPEAYLVWLEQLAQMGYLVVWEQWDTNVPPANASPLILQVYKGALKRIITSGNIAPKTDDAGGILAVIVGHSAGAWETFPTAAASWDRQYEIPPFRAIVAIEPGQGQLPTYDLSGIDASTKLIVVVGDQDKAKRRCDAATVWGSLTQIPAANKDFLEVISDARGTPQQLGNHYFPLTDTTLDTLPPPSVDDRDYNVTWKLSVGLSDCTIYGTLCGYGLGHGSSEQIGMGDWSDGVPVNPLLWVRDPVTTFQPDCESSSGVPDTSGN